MLVVALCGCLVLGMTACKDLVEEEPADSTPGESQIQDDITETEPADNGGDTQESETQNGGNQGTETDTETETETETETQKNTVSNEGHNDESGWGKVEDVFN